MTTVLLSQGIEKETRSLRHKLHKMPELGWNEKHTLDLIYKELSLYKKQSQLSFKINENKGGLFVDITPPHCTSGMILFRADIDALPIKEMTSLPYSSKIDGMMHACGHDMHTAMLLSAIKLISNGSSPVNRPIRCVFQRAEEGSGSLQSGGKTLIQEGILNNIEYVYGLHISTNSKKGLFSSKGGHFLANTAILTIEIASTGGHVMQQNTGSSSLEIMNDILTMQKILITQFFSSTEQISMTPTIARSGSFHNIRPNSAYITFTIRDFIATERREAFIFHFKKKILAIIESYHSASLNKFSWIQGYPSLINDPTNFTYVHQLLKKENLLTEEATKFFAGDDFAFYLKERKGSYWILGASQENSGDHHTSQFSPDESILHLGVAFWLLLAKA